MQPAQILIALFQEGGPLKEAIMQGEPRSNPVLKLLRLFADAGKAFWRRRTAVNALADREVLAQIAQDLGISAADLRALASRDKTAADLLNRRLKTLRLDPASVDPAASTE